MISPLGYMVYYQEFETGKITDSIEMKKIKSKIFIKDYEILIIENYINKTLILEYFAK